MTGAADSYTTAVVAAHLAGVDLDAIGLPRARWAEAGLPSIGVDLDMLAAALAGAPGPTGDLLHLADGLLGGAGRPGPRTGSPFDAVRLLARDTPPLHPAAAVAPPPARPVDKVGSLETLSANVLIALRHSSLGAPGAPDVPLVEYVRARVALVAAAARWLAAAPSGAALSEAGFLWASGDLSGIQAYLYGIATIGEGGVARRLRARSLFLQLLAEDTAERLRRAAGVVRANVLLRSGGKFHLLLPDTEATRAALTAEQQRLDRWLLDETQGEVAFVLTAHPAPAGDLAHEHVGATLRRVEADLARRKAMRFATALRPNGSWDEAAFLRPALGGGGEVCGSCRKQTAPTGQLCRRCEADTQVGRALPRARFAWLVPSDAAAAGLRITLAGSTAVLGGAGDEPPRRLRRIPLVARSVPGEASGLGAYIPSGSDGAPLTFEEMAKRGRGRELLGFLKMDVDRLGEVFALGLRRDGGPALDTLPRLAALSRLLDEFFSHELRQLIEKEFPLCYQVYAGGDDVLVVGPWWDTVRLAARVRAAFRRCVHDNPEITISAGLTLAHVKTPVATAAADADEALEAAKRGVRPPDAGMVEARIRRGVAGEHLERPAPVAPCVPACGRDCAALLGDVLSWRHVEVAIEQAERLAAARPPGTLLHRLLAFAGMWSEFRDGDPAGLRLFPYLAYQVRRNVDQRTQPDLWQWTQELTGASYRAADEQGLLEHLGLVARLALLLTEGERR